MSVDVIEDLVVIMKGSIPADVTRGEIGEDLVYTLATIMARAEEEVSRLERNSKLGTSSGAFTDLHAKDRDLRRQDGETDDQLIARCQNPPRAVTPKAIRTAITAIVGGAGQVVIVELPRDAAYLDGNSFFFDRDDRIGGGRGVVIALIPEAAAAAASVADALRTKVSGGKLWLVQEYTTP